jgi:hypothetical protein
MTVAELLLESKLKLLLAGVALELLNLWYRSDGYFILWSHILFM